MSDRAVRILATASVIVLIGLRLYALFFTASPRTGWDDRGYRSAAIADAAATTPGEAAAAVLVPGYARTLGRAEILEAGGRTVGYHAALVAGLHAATSSNTERNLQSTNVVLFVLQILLVFLLARWAACPPGVALAASFLYGASPLVFGMSRWILTENFAFTGMLVWVYIAAILATTRRSDGDSWRTAGIAVLGAYVMGIFSTAREYTLPVLGLLSAATALGFWIEGERRAALGFVGVLVPFAAAATLSLQNALPALQRKSQMSQYLRPFGAWLQHATLDTLGAPLSVLLVIGVAGVATAAVQTRRRGGNRPSSRNRSLVLLLAAESSLPVLYVLGTLVTSNRGPRIAAPILIATLAAIFTAHRLYPELRELAARRVAQLLLVVLMLGAWGLQAKALWLDDDGGRTYAFHGIRLPQFNAPLGIAEGEPPHYHGVPATPAELRDARQRAGAE